MKSNQIVFLCGIIFLTLTGVQAFWSSKSRRCSCIDVSANIYRKSIVKLEQFPPGPSCKNSEIIVTLENGIKKCLDPDSPHVKKEIEAWKKMKSHKNNKPKRNKIRKMKNASKNKKSQRPLPKKTA
ncbi:C-X-C motif chemokine 9 [Gracilinanus agilis]|uniref:C-X-C motif chemokine 9 n=1 Tax=Gracilinanus agilis TaxID=191870 RepID=UPI001CFCA511|nr:C-X-C motif chemokine 9 [Gracilinanus agilis]